MLVTKQNKCSVTQETSCLSDNHKLCVLNSVCISYLSTELFFLLYYVNLLTNIIKYYVTINLNIQYHTQVNQIQFRY